MLHLTPGRTDMWGLTQLLTAEHSSPLAALALALPCPALPADAQQQAQQADARQQQGRGAEAASAGAPGGSSSPFTTQWLASLTPGVAAVGDAGRFAEAVVLRGPRSAGGALSLGTAAASLDAALAQERRRCVQQRTLVAQPLAVPLPFPHIFASGLSQCGGLPAGGKLGGGSQDVVSCAVLTRLGATSVLGPVVAAAQRQFRAAAGAGQGQAALESWGIGREEVQEMDERLTQLIHLYDEGDA